jgi:hypothetical protein
VRIWLTHLFLVGVAAGGDLAERPVIGGPGWQSVLSLAGQDDTTKLRKWLYNDE